METYNGWKNRSTWLVKLHLDNDGQDITNRAEAIAIEANTERQFENKIKVLLLDVPELDKEQAYDIREVDFAELWDNMRPSTKY